MRRRASEWGSARGSRDQRPDLRLLWKRRDAVNTPPPPPEREGRRRCRLKTAKKEKNNTREETVSLGVIVLAAGAPAVGSPPLPGEDTPQLGGGDGTPVDVSWPVCFLQ